MLLRGGCHARAARLAAWLVGNVVALTRAAIELDYFPVLETQETAGSMPNSLGYKHSGVRLPAAASRQGRSRTQSEG